MQLQVRPGDNDRAARVVDALAEEVLAEAPLLALQHVREALEGPVRGAAHRVGLAAVVEERVDRLLQHPLLVPQNHLRRLNVDEALEPVVADDDPAVQVVQVTGRKPSAIEGDERAQLRRNDRNYAHHHPLRLVDAVLVGLAEGLHHVEPLQRLRLALLARLGSHLVAELLGELIELKPFEHRLDRLTTNLGDELLLVVVLEPVVVVPNLVEDFVVLLLCQELVLLDPKPLGRARLDDDVVLVVDDLLQVLGLEPKQVPDLVGQRLEVPDVDHRHAQGNVPHALSADRLPGDLHAAPVTDNPLVPDALVFPAVALIVLNRAEDFLAEETTHLRLKGPVVDGLGLHHLAVRPLQNILRRRKANGDAIEVRFDLCGITVRHI